MRASLISANVAEDDDGLATLSLLSCYNSYHAISLLSLSLM